MSLEPLFVYMYLYRLKSRNGVLVEKLGSTFLIEQNYIFMPNVPLTNSNKQMALMTVVFSQ